MAEMCRYDTHPSTVIKDSKLFSRMGSKRDQRREQRGKAIGRLRTWAHQSCRNEYLIARIQELNQLTDQEVVSTLRTMKARK